MTALVAAGLTGCAVQVGYKDAGQRAAALSAFRAGNARLGCPAGENCLFTWISTRPAATRLMQAQRWEDLADVVLAANYDQDLAWFYLGLAASGLGYQDVARSYLDRSVQRTIIGGFQTCLPNLCDGINLPADARTLMASLPADVEPVRRTVAARPRRAPVRHAAKPESAGWVGPVGGGTPAAATEPQAGSGWVAPVPE